MMDKYKCIVSTVGLVCVTGLQLFAWQTGHNGTVFALTSTVIGGIIGFSLGIKLDLGNNGTLPTIQTENKEDLNEIIKQ